MVVPAVTAPGRLAPRSYGRVRRPARHSAAPCCERAARTAASGSLGAVARVRTWVAAGWGLGGILLLLGSAVVRLSPVAIAPLREGVAWWVWVLYVVWIAFNAWAEGYRAFQKQWAPRVVARAVELGRRGGPWLAVAPLVCMGLLHATRKRLVVSWALTAAIVGVVVLVRNLPQPWRGVIDAGVVVGLAWGMAAVVAWAVRAWRGEPMPVPSDMPGPGPFPPPQAAG